MNGFVTQIIGPVIDVEFPEGELPKIYNALEVTKALSNEKIIAEQKSKHTKFFRSQARTWPVNICWPLAKRLIDC
jgi:F0F1-type ATP synthase beta subunit